MGNRKERRMAAKTAVNRRVKLDLIEEPSGDFGDSSNKEEVEGGGKSKIHAGSPNSPSSSEGVIVLVDVYFKQDMFALPRYSFQTVRWLWYWELNWSSDPVQLCHSVSLIEIPHDISTTLVVRQKPENPLSLLGQYSDEETEEESVKEIRHDTLENSPAKLDEQVKVDSHEGTEADKGENFTAEKADQENKEHSSSLDDEKNGVIEDITVLPSHKDMAAVDQTSVPWTSDTQTENTDSGWKMVLHEESNSYYYWNIVTGETSWEVPVDFVQGNESAYEPQSVTEVEEMHVPSVDTQPNDGPTQSLAFESTENDSCRPGLEVHNENHIDTISNDVVEGNYVNTVDSAGNGEAHNTDSYHLLQLGESLSERLKSLKGENEKISKLRVELDIRLADIKSLVPYGSTLLPFWLHSENHLRKLETAINSEILEHSQFPNIGQTNEAEAEKKVQENISESTATANDNGNEKEKNAVSADTDDDMDVEMEVEDEPGVQNGPHSEEEFEVPPPPVDEWVPPPPPDDEPLPPPPPDEPPEATFPPPPPSQSYSYGEQYNFAYAGPSYEYYGQQVPNHDYYVDAAAAPIPSVYYTTVQNPYPDGGASVVNPLEPVTYYTLQEASVPIQPVIGSESVASTVSTAPTEPVPKAQPKVARNKKRTVATVPGLRSNKKVSGLVDKWKAVKEELHEDEEDDEPENALEVLEKKRQREIEQWHAQQIATGEAKDNANFQPLGGDWRERVRRKRAKKSTETEESQGIDETTKCKPDLVQLTKQLPSGWQAYWDEASKQVYYGNSNTSETSWTKPKK